MHSQEELLDILFDTIEKLDTTKAAEKCEEAKDNILSYLYIPDRRLPAYLSKLRDKIKESEKPKKQRNQNFHVEIGRLMEQIAYLCFNSLKGVTNIKSFQSAGPQYDLIVTGDSVRWLTLCKTLYLDINQRDFLIEVKDTKKRVDDQQFARLCSLLHLNLYKTSGIGIFFTIKGATGFPKPSNVQRQRALRDARLRQVMFMVSCKKPIVVFDEHDIFELDKPGSLLKLLLTKIRDVEQLTGILKPPEINEPVECDLPDHLLKIESH